MSWVPSIPRPRLVLGVNVPIIMRSMVCMALCRNRDEGKNIRATSRHGFPHWHRQATTRKLVQTQDRSPMSKIPINFPPPRAPRTAQLLICKKDAVALSIGSRFIIANAILKRNFDFVGKPVHALISRKRPIATTTTNGRNRQHPKLSAIVNSSHHLDALWGCRIAICRDLLCGPGDSQTPSVSVAWKGRILC
ncbi:hypothetical protein BJX64DRAFT_265096 [Aspergillus heterothallicus]